MLVFQDFFYFNFKEFNFQYFLILIIYFNFKNSFSNKYNIYKISYSKLLKKY